MTPGRPHLNTLAPNLVAALLLVACGSSPSGGRAGDGGPGVGAGDISFVGDGAPGSDGGGSDRGPTGDGTTATDTGTPPDKDAGCTENESRCASETVVEACTFGEWKEITTCPSPLVCVNGGCESGAGCTAGQVLGCADAHSIKKCSASGGSTESIPCPGEQFCLKGLCGLKMCEPGTPKCRDAQTLHICNADGTDWVDPKPCGEGSVCIKDRCLSGCDADYKFGSYVGCEYWTVDLDQYEDPFSDPEPQPHAVVISNPGKADAHITFESFSTIPVQIADPTVPAGTAVAFEMPRHDLDGTGIFNRSIRIRSDRPVLAMQFNPFNNENVFSNDGTLLLPTATLGKEYYVLSWPSGADIDIPFPGVPKLTPQKGYITIVAVRKGKTKVWVRFSADTEGTIDAAANDVIVPLPPYNKGALLNLELERGQVLQLTARPIKPFGGGGSNPNDLTGTFVRSNGPIMVFGGHEEAVIATIESKESCCAEHLEEQMLPVKALNGRVLCAKSASRGGEDDLWRIVATQPLSVSTDPPQTTIDGQTVTDLPLQAGQWIEIHTPDSFLATATGKILVGQYLVSQEQTDRYLGDPALIHGIPVDQWRSDYPILTPKGYDEDWLTVMRMAGAPVFFDGTKIDDAEFKAVAQSGFEVAQVKVSAGPHRLSGLQPFGLIQMGYSQAVSYGLAAGLNIKELLKP